MKPLIALLLTLALTPLANANQVLLHDEFVDGDLANFINAPPFMSPGTPLGPLSIGSNIVRGLFGTSGLTDQDLFTVEVPSGTRLSDIQLTYQPFGDVGTGSYFAVNDGPDLGIAFSTAAQNLSDALVGESGSLLQAFIDGPWAQGLGISGPLESGTYTFALNETSATVEFELDLQLTPVPIPPAALLMLSGVVLLARYAPSRGRR
ncbi:MAG: hypothetical protein AAF493_06055 [Pseudomonadota bacterium]